MMLDDKSRPIGVRTMRGLSHCSPASGGRVIAGDVQKMCAPQAETLSYFSGVIAGDVTLGKMLLLRLSPGSPRAGETTDKCTRT